MKSALMIAALMAATATVSFAQEPASKEPEILSDGVGAPSVRIDHLHKVRFIEIFLAGRSAKTGQVVAAVYNSSLSPTATAVSKDTAPQAWVESLDFAQMKKDFSVLGASLNGPKLWMPDWVEVENGVKRDFNGVKVPWVATLNIAGVSENKPYKPMTIDRKSSVGWNKGTTVLLLDDAEGTTWVMKGFQQGLKPAYSYEEFVAGGASQFKQLPAGWKFRVKVLDKDLIETPEGGVATIMSDEFFNVYDKTGPGMTNYTP